MSYKRILVHLNDQRRAAALMRVAVGLAQVQDGELIGLHVVPGAASLTAVVVPYGAEITGAAVDSDRKVGQALEAAFRAATKGRESGARWLEIETQEPDLCAVALQHARLADLVVAAQSDRDWPVSDLLDFPERLALESGRPVLVVPNGFAGEQVGSRILVAWSGTREAARAAFDALPLMARAQSVHVVSVSGESFGADTVLAGDLADALAGHGIRVSSEEIVASGAEVSDLLLSRASSLGADLLVMGAYGHSRWREYVFGGVTRAITRHMTVPTLLSH